MLQKPQTCSGCPLFEVPYGKKDGYVPAHGDGSNGVLLVLEAAGEDEEGSGVPLIGKAGQYFWSQLARVGIERDGFRVHNVLSCRPPDNKLIKMPYTEAAIEHCSPNLDQTIKEHIEYCKGIGKTPVILALGKFAANRVMGWEDKLPITKQDYYSYPFWSIRYGCFIINGPHPSYVMQGNHEYANVLQFCAQRAISIASEGLTLEHPRYLLDPDPAQFNLWIDEFLRELKKNPDSTYLSYDIETSYKKGKSEDEVGKDESDDRTILRCSFCWKPGNAVSVPWTTEYISGIERLFTSGAHGLGWNSQNYDDSRVIAYIPKFNLITLDGMLAWHCLHSSLPKSLGFVTPFYWHSTSMWKHLSESEPALYNAIDADAALRCWLGILPNLKEYDLYPVFERHVLKLNEVLRYMTSQGIHLDLEARKAAEEKLSLLQNNFKQKMQEVIPIEARSFKVYKKTPKDLSGLVTLESTRISKQCPSCLALDVKADHFKSVGAKKLKSGQPENPCVGLVSVKVPIKDNLYALPLEFKLSIKSLLKYQSVKKHKAIIDRKKKKVTFDESAIKQLRMQYSTDPLYATIIDFREVQTLLSRYVGRTQENGTVKGGMTFDRNGLIHTLYSHNPSTLRLASQQPNLQNLPRPDPKDQDALANLIRNMIVAPKGWVLGARDFSGIEAVLVGYEAKDKDYIRLAWRDVHSFYTAWALYELEKKLSYNDLPQLSWDDDKLFSRLADIKQEFKKERNNLFKHLVHGCLTGDHEVLTPIGWKRLDSINLNDQIAQWNSGKLDFVIPTHIIDEAHSGHLVNVSGRGLKVLMTPDHRVPYHNTYGTLKTLEAQDLLDLTGDPRIPVCGTLYGAETVNPSFLQFLAAVQADGSIYPNNIRFHLVKQRKRDRLHGILNDLGLSYTSIPCSDHADGEQFTIQCADTTLSGWFIGNPKTKTFNLGKLLNLKAHLREGFLQELPLWDGHKPGSRSGTQESYMSTNYDNASTVQTIAHTLGHQAILRCLPQRDGRKDLYKVSYNNRTQVRVNQPTTTITELPFEGRVYCVTVPSSFFLVRYQGTISITGNCNFGQMAKGARDKIYEETGIVYDTKLITQVMNVYRELFPRIPTWHKEIRREAADKGFLRNNFGYIHRFNHVFRYVQNHYGLWDEKPGDDAEAVLAFKPQSTAAAILKEAMLRAYFDRFEEAGQFMRLTTHDEILWACPPELQDSVDSVFVEEMEKPIPQMPMPPEWNMGEYLRVFTEGKTGTRWGEMH